MISLPDTPLRLKPGRVVSIDVETYSEVDIKAAGSWRYALDPSTELLILCWSFDEGQTVHTWVPGDPPPDDLMEAIRDGYIVRAFNSEFERAIWDNVCVPTLGWEPVKFEQWYDTMSMSYTHALPGSLEKAATALRLKVKKDPTGKRLINKFCKPRKPTKNNPSTRLKPADDPEDFERFCSYCADDVRVECAVYASFPRPQFRVGEEHTWRMTCKMNEFGIRLDVEAFQAIRKMLAWWRTKRLARLQEITDGELHTDGQREKAMTWLASRGVELKGYTKDDIVEALAWDIDPYAREFLEIRQELSQVSTKKYDAMDAVVWNGRTHNNMVYHRATTGRNGGSGLQLHNFPRDSMSKKNNLDLINDCIRLIIEEHYDAVVLIYGNPIDVAKRLLRAMIIPDEGKIFYCADFSSVENIVTVWVCQDPVGLDVFENGVDQYKAFGAKQFGIPIDQVSDVVRTESKATILGSMFGAGWKTIFATNQQKGIPMTQDQAKQNVSEFREQYKVTAQSWYELADSVKEAVDNPGKVITYKGLKFSLQYEYLWIRLHSGRMLAYPGARNEWVKTPWGERKWQTTVMTTNARSQWIRQTMTPSKIIENIVQAVARDLLMFSQHTLNNHGFELLLNVHDEILSQQRPGYMPLARFVELMVQKPDWAHSLPRSLPLKAEGYTAMRYRK